MINNNCYNTTLNKNIEIVYNITNTDYIYIINDYYPRYLFNDLDNQSLEFIVKGINELGIDFFYLLKSKNYFMGNELTNIINDKIKILKRIEILNNISI